MALAGVIEKEPRKHREADKDRDIGKLQWEELYFRRSKADFVEMRITRRTFNNIPEKIRDKIELQPTNLKPNPTSTERQLALTFKKKYLVNNLTSYIKRFLYATVVAPSSTHDTRMLKESSLQ